MKKTTILLTVIMFFSAWVNAETIAYWRFEQGTNGIKHTGELDNWYLDSSGNTNHLSAETNDENPYATNDLPFAAVPLTGETNLLAGTFDGNMSLGAYGTYSEPTVPINEHIFNNGFTVECMVKYFDFNFTVAVGNDGRPTPYGDPLFALKHRDEVGHPLQLAFFDGTTNNHKLYSARFIDTGIWYYVAAVCDGTNAYLYIKTREENAYQLEATETNINGSALFYEDGAIWTVGRGMWGGVHNSYLNGCIDEVRISDSALSLSEFLGTAPSFPLVTITNQDATVDYDTDKYTIGGNNNENVVGYMTWSNQLTATIGTLSAAANWTIPDIGLAVGANVIVVIGTNSLGDISSDSITIIRKNGRGTEALPYTIAEARALPAGTESFWAQGYIVGGNYDNFNSPFVNNNGVCCADSANETDMNNCLQVTLDSGTGFPDIWGLQSHPENIGKRIKFHGIRGNYSGKPSFESVDQIIEIYPENVIAYWRFEQGTNGTTRVGELDNWYLDSSGYGNNLSANTDAENPYSTNDIPFTAVPLTGKTNLLAGTFDGSMSLGTYSTMREPIVQINHHHFTNGFTVECMVKYFDFNFTVAVGNDGRPTPYGDPLFALKHRDEAGHPLQLAFFDGTTNNHKLYSERFIDTGIWYYVAAVCDGTNAYLYIKTKEETAYQLEATETNINGSALFYEDGAVWTVGRGMWGGVHNSYLNGCIDEVRICDTALDETQFLAADEIPEPFCLPFIIYCLLFIIRRK